MGWIAGGDKLDPQNELENTDHLWDEDEGQGDDLEADFKSNPAGAFVWFRDGMAKELAHAQLEAMIQYREIAKARGLLMPVQSLVLDALREGRAMDSALDSIAKLLAEANFVPGMPGLVESRPVLRDAIREFCIIVYSLARPTAPKGEVLLQRLECVLKRLDAIPIGTEMEPANFRRLSHALEIARSHLPGLWSLHLPEFSALAERWGRADSAMPAAHEFLTTTFSRPAGGGPVRINCSALRLCARAASELVRGMTGICRDLSGSRCFVIIDLTGAKSLEPEAMQSLLRITQIAEEREIAVLIAADVLLPKIARLVPDALSLIDSREDCVNFFDLWQQGEQLHRDLG